MQSDLHRTVQASILATICTLLVPGTLHAQLETGSRPGHVAFSHMHTLLERTFLRVDVLTLDICVDSTAARRIGAAVGDAPPRDAADSIAAAVMGARQARARIRMLRNVGLSRFVDGVLAEQRKAVRAGLLDDSTHRAVRLALPEWFAALRERGLSRGDEIVYEIRADTVYTTYVTAEGDTLVRHSAIGWQWRTSVLATYFAPGSSFRDGLIESLGHPVPADAARACRARTRIGHGSVH